MIFLAILAFGFNACTLTVHPVTVRFRLDYGGKGVIGIWSQQGSKPSRVTFDKVMDSVVSVTISNPVVGIYTIKAVSTKGTTTATINVSK